MSVAKRVEEAIERMIGGDAEAALIPASIAVDATASREHPNMTNNVAYKQFLSDNLLIITKVAFRGTSIGGGLRVVYSDPELKPDAEGLCSFEQIMYHVVRCGLLHGARLPSDLQFVHGNTISVDPDTNSLILPAKLILGLLVAVVVSPVNAGETTTENKTYELNYRGCPIALHCFWGKKEQFLEEIAKLDAGF